MRKLLLITAGLVVSLLLCIYALKLEGCIFLLPVFLCLILFCVLLRKIFSYWKSLIYFLVGCIIALLLLVTYNKIYLSPIQRLDGNIITSSVVVADFNKTENYSNSVECRITIDDMEYKTILYYSNEVSLSPGDCVDGKFRIHYTGFGAEKESTYLQGSGIFLITYADEVTYKTNQKTPLRFYGVLAREAIIDILNKSFPADTVGFARALLIGDSTGLSFKTDTDFKISGIRHIIAVSGLHISILFSFVYILSGKRKWFAALFGIPILIAFAAIAGFTPSVVRACLMHGLMILALVLNKDYDPPTALAFAVCVLLLANPFAILSVSLQLSAGCLVGIFCFSSKISGYLLDKKRFGPAKDNTVRSKLARWFVGSVSVSISASVATFPLCALYFGMFSIVGILTNLLTLWIVSIIFCGIIFVVLSYFAFPILAKYIAFFVSLLMRYVITVAELLSDIPFAAIYTKSVYTVIWLIFAYLLLGVFFVFRYKRPAVLACCLVISLSISIFVSWLEPRLDNYRYTIFNVGQGQCILLQADGKNYLVDCGGDNNILVANTVISELRSQGVQRLDGIILSHFDTDHVGAAENILSEFDVDNVYISNRDPGSTIDDFLYTEYFDVLQTVDDITFIDNGTHKLSIFPPEDGASGNESSLSVLFQTEYCDILITGDRNIASENALLSNYDIPNVDILVAGHHGSKNSTGQPLLSATMPKTVVFSVGKNNRFGHPHMESIERIIKSGCDIYRTDMQGTIVFRG